MGTLSPFIQPELNSSRTEWKLGVAPWYKITTPYKRVYKYADAKLFANKHDDYEQVLQFDYAPGNDRVRVPYVTFGDVGRSATSSERQLRLRTGILYI